MIQSRIAASPRRCFGSRGIAAAAATALFAGIVAAQIPARPPGGLKIAPAASFTITAKAGEGGKIVPEGSISVRAGATQQFGIVPNSGWSVLSVNGCGGTGVKIAAEQTTYTTGRAAASCGVLASFVHRAPRLTSFKINNGAVQTLTRSVTVSYTAAPGPSYPAPTRYRVSMRSDFLGAEWKSLSGTTAGIGHELEPGAGTKTLYFQLLSANGMSVSEVLSDSIDLAQRQLYTVAAREFYDAALQAGFATRVIDRATCAVCTVIPGPADGIAADLVVARATRQNCGSTSGPLCRIDFFARGALRSKVFVFKSIGETIGVSPECPNIARRYGGPVPEGTSVNFQVELNSFGAQCDYQLRSVFLEGPPNRSWREALGLAP